MVGVRAEWTEPQMLEALSILETERTGFAGDRFADHRRGRRDSRELTVTWPPIVVSGTPFRRADRSEFESVLRVMPPPTHAWSYPFRVRVYDDELSIPFRIYSDEPARSVVLSLTDRQQLMLHCLYTRHHDGYVRQRHLACIIGSTEPWVVPYVVQLIGEYVVEIVEEIAASLPGHVDASADARRMYGRFVESAPEYFWLVKQRVASYWSAYYQSRYSKSDEVNAAGPRRYPGFVAVELLERLASELRT